MAAKNRTAEQLAQTYRNYFKKNKLSEVELIRARNVLKRYRKVTDFKTND